MIYFETMCSIGIYIYTNLPEKDNQLVLFPIDFPVKEWYCNLYVFYSAA